MPEGQATVCRRAGRVRMPRLPESKCFSRPARLLRPAWVSAGLFAFNPGLDFRKKPDIRNRFKRRARGGKLRQETFAKIPLHPTAEAQTQASGCFLFPISLFSPRIPDNQASGPPFGRQQAHLACWPLSTGSNTSPSDAFGLRFRQRMLAVGFAHNTV